MSDARSYESEVYAFQHLGFECIKTECELMSELGYCRVPEGIFWDCKNRYKVSVEVKRLIGNELPREGKSRRIVRRRKSIIWPWTSTVESAIEKAHPKITDLFTIEMHHVVFVVPEQLSAKSFRRLHQHINEVASRFMNYTTIGVPVSVHIIKGPSTLFDRF